MSIVHFIPTSRDNNRPPTAGTSLSTRPPYGQVHVSPAMDIDDILRTVDADARGIPADTRDLQALTRRWVAERSAPELLECETPLLSPIAHLD